MRSLVQAHQLFDSVERRDSEQTGALRALSEDGIKRLRLGRQIQVPLPNGLERRDDQVRDRTLQDGVALSHERGLHCLTAPARQQFIDRQEVGHTGGRLTIYELRSE